MNCLRTLVCQILLLVPCFFSWGELFNTKNEIAGQYVIRFDAAGTELDLAPGSNINVQGQTLVLPRSSDSGLTLDQRAMVSFCPSRVAKRDIVN